MGAIVLGIGVMEFLLILGYKNPFPYAILNIVFGVIGIVGGIFMMREDSKDA